MDIGVSHRQQAVIVKDVRTWLDYVVWNPKERSDLKFEEVAALADELPLPSSTLRCLKTSTLHYGRRPHLLHYSISIAGFISPWTKFSTGSATAEIGAWCSRAGVGKLGPLGRTRSSQFQVKFSQGQVRSSRLLWIAELFLAIPIKLSLLFLLILLNLFLLKVFIV